MAAGTEGADGDSLAFQIGRLADLRSDPELVGKNVYCRRHDGQICAAADGTRRGSDAGGRDVGFPGNQSLRSHRSAATEYSGDIDPVLSIRALICAEPDASMGRN